MATFNIIFPTERAWEIDNALWKKIAPEARSTLVELYYTPTVGETINLITSNKEGYFRGEITFTVGYDLDVFVKIHFYDAINKEDETKWELYYPPGKFLPPVVFLDIDKWFDVFLRDSLLQNSPPDWMKPF